MARRDKRHLDGRKIGKGARRRVQEAERHLAEVFGTSLENAIC